MNDKIILEKADGFIENFDFQKAQKLLDSIKNQSQSDRRHTSYLKGKIHLKNGELKEAIKVFTQTLSSFGSHISILSDLTVCYYAMGDFINWNRSLTRLENEFAENSHQFNAETNIRALCLIGQFKEELGLINEASKAYEKARVIGDSTDEVRFSNYKVISQLLRIGAEYGVKRKFDYGLVLKQMNDSALATEFNVEVQYNLMVSDFYSLGADIALSRFLNLLKSYKLDDEDKSLFCGQLVFMFLDYKQLIPDNLLGVIENINNPTLEQQFLFSMLNVKSKDDFYKQVLLLLQSHWPTGQRLRVLSLLCKHEYFKYFRHMLEQEFSRFVKPLSLVDMKLWYEKASLNNVSGTVVIEIITDKLNLTCNNTVVSLNRRKTAMELCLSLSKSNKVNLDTVSIDLWGVQFENRLKDRLRMQVSRLNRTFFELTGLDDVLKVDDYGLILDDRVSLTCRD